MKSKRAELSSEFIASHAFPFPLASRRFCKRKRTIEFLFDTQPPTGFHLPTEWTINPLLSSQNPTSAPIEKEIVSQTVRSSSILDFKSLDSEKDATSSIQSNINREPSVMEVNIPETDKREDNFSISKSASPAPSQIGAVHPKSETLTGGTTKIIEALQVLGKGTGHQIATWISKRYGETEHSKKKLSYIVNSILCNKKNSSLFVKNNAVVDGKKRIMWRLVDEDVHDMLSPLEYEDLPVVVDDAALQAFEEQEEGEPEPVQQASPPKPVVKRETKRLSSEPAKRKREDEEKESEDEPRLRPTKHEEPSKIEKPTPHRSKQTYESESDEKHVSAMAIEDKEAEQVSPPKTKKTKTKHETPEDEPKPDKTEDAEQYGSFDDLSELEFKDKSDKGSDEWKKRAKSRVKSYSSRRKKNVDDDTGSPSASPSFPSMSSEAIMSSNNNSTYNSEDSMDPEGSTYTEMIEQALRALGGRGTGTEITTFIDENYHDVLSNKTRTWKNSVMGCLSANRRKLFAKEPVKEHAKRYVWRLNDPSLNLSPLEPLSPVLNSPVETSPVLNSKKRKSTSPNTKPEPVEAPMVIVVPEIIAEKEDDDVELPRKKMEKKKEQKESKEKQPEEEKKEEIVVPEALEEEEESDNDEFEESTDEPRSRAKKDTKKSKMKGSDDRSLISLIETALAALGGSGTGSEVTDWILERKDEAMVTSVIAPDLCANKKKLSYTVNATLSSKKYRNIFMKDTSSTTGRAVWKLTSKK